MVTKEPKTEWVSAKISRADRDALERIALKFADGSLSAGLRVAIRKADPDRRTRQTAGGVG